MNNFNHVLSVIVQLYCALTVFLCSSASLRVVLFIWCVSPRLCSSAQNRIEVI